MSFVEFMVLVDVWPTFLHSLFQDTQYMDVMSEVVASFSYRGMTVACYDSFQ